MTARPSYEEFLDSKTQLVMRTAGMIDYPAPGTVKLEDWVVLQEVAA